MPNKVAPGPGIIMVPVILIAAVVGVKAMQATAADATPSANATTQHGPVIPGKSPSAHKTPDPGSKTPAAGSKEAAAKAVTARINAIEKYADHDVGEKLWAKTVWKPYVNNGVEGCAASVTWVLWQGGVQISGHDNVLVLANQLMAAGWKRIPITSESQMRTGDVVYGSNSKTDEHIGIVGSVSHGVMIYDNNSNTGKWGYHTIAGGYGDFVPGGRFKAGHLWVLRYEG